MRNERKKRIDYLPVYLFRLEYVCAIYGNYGWKGEKFISFNTYYCVNNSEYIENEKASCQG